MIKYFKEAWDQKPFQLIIWMAVLLRVIAAIFSKGFGMHDDHFLVIEAAQSWVDGYDYNNWLPGSSDNPVPSGHSFFYVGIHYLIFLFFKFIGISDPQTKMFIIRLIHGAFSLIVVAIGYRTVEKVSGIKAARITGLLLAVYWFMPFLSVRNLVEVVCIPFLMAGTWIVIKDWEEEKSAKYFLLAGLVIGLAFSVRFQTGMFAFGLGLALLLKKRWKDSVIYGIGFILSVVIIQGGIDFFVWGKPFMELGEYVRYNLENATEYITGAWYNYILLVLGILIPPVSIFIVVGIGFSWKKYFVIFIPVVLFFVFHSLFPNKQERFILPVIPFVIMMGIAGWMQVQSKFEQGGVKRKLIHGGWVFFWTINLLLLPIITTMYSKKARVESMVYLSKYDNVVSVLMENTTKGSVKMAPRYYLTEWVKEIEVSQGSPIENLSERIFTNLEYTPRFFYSLKTWIWICVWQKCRKSFQIWFMKRPLNRVLLIISFMK
ncbi:MAG: glycosyltransferase family 39 protein [Bacteroidales bacterium]